VSLIKMKKSGIITLAIVSSLALTACSKEDEKQKQHGFTVHGWSNSDDTLMAGQTHGGYYYSPGYFYYSRFGLFSHQGYYEAMRTVNRGSSVNPQYHSIRSLSGESSFSSRGGFGHISAGRTSVS
jgi:hypothetical protein